MPEQTNAAARQQSPADQSAAAAAGEGRRRAPDSRAQTWDVIRGAYGPDVAFLDRALAQTFARFAVAPSRLAIGGFSGGGSYALSLGVMAPAARRGAPRIFVSHGTQDRVLPIDRCGRRVVPELKRAGYDDVRYHEFDGPHTVPPGVAREAARWFAGPERNKRNKGAAQQ